MAVFEKVKPVLYLPCSRTVHTKCYFFTFELYFIFTVYAVNFWIQVQEEIPALKKPTVLLWSIYVVRYTWTYFILVSNQMMQHMCIHCDILDYNKI